MGWSGRRYLRSGRLIWSDLAERGIFPGESGGDVAGGGLEMMKKVG